MYKPNSNPLKNLFNKFCLGTNSCHQQDSSQAVQSIQLKRKFRSVLVTGHRSNRLPTQSEQLKLLSETLYNVLIALGKAGDAAGGAQCRLITGNEEGTDICAMELAKTLAGLDTKHWSQRVVIAPVKKKKWSDDLATSYIYVSTPFASKATRQSARKALSCRGCSQNGCSRRCAPWRRSPGYDLRRVPCDHPILTRNALRGGINQCFQRAEELQPEESLPEQWIDIADSTKLHYADVVVALWDGKPPSGSACGGGAVRSLREALRRSMPVIWIDASEEKIGRVHLSNNGGLDDTTMMMIDAQDHDIRWCGKAFSEIDVTPDLNKAIASWLNHYWTTKLEDHIEKALVYWDSDKKPVCDGWIYRWLFKLFSWNQKKSSDEANRDTSERVIDGMNTDDFWSRFDSLDRAATRAAGRYRDNIILLFLFSSLAVFGAVAGAIKFMEFDWFWGLFESLTLAAIIYLLYKDSKLNSHESWLFFRQAAESFRLNFFMIEQLATLPEVYRGIFGKDQKDQLSIKKPFKWLMLESLREAGPPQRKEPFVLQRDGSASLGKFREFVKDQVKYHKKTGEKNERAHQRMHLLTRYIFGLVLMVVFMHLYAVSVEWLEPSWPWAKSLAEFIHHQKWLLLVTAFLPAFAASLHGIMTTLEFERLASASKKVGERLEAFEAMDAQKSENNFLTQRGLVIAASKNMYEEQEAWAELIDAQKIGIPA